MSHSHGPRPLSTGSRSSLLERKELEGASTPNHPLINSRRAQQRKFYRLLWIRKTFKCPSYTTSVFKLIWIRSTNYDQPIRGAVCKPQSEYRDFWPATVTPLPCLPVKHTPIIPSRLKVCLPAGEGKSSCERMDNLPAKLTSTIIGEFCFERTIFGII